MKTNQNSWLMIVRRSLKKEHLELLLNLLMILIAPLLMMALWGSNFKDIKTLTTQSLLAISIRGLQITGILLVITLIALMKKPKISIIISLVFLGLFLYFSYPVFEFLHSYAHNTDPFNSFNHGPTMLSHLNYELYGLTLIGSLISVMSYFIEQLPIKWSITRKYKQRH